MSHGGKRTPRLVQQQQFRIRRHRARKSDDFLLTIGQIVRPHVPYGPKFEKIDDLLEKSVAAAAYPSRADAEKSCPTAVWVANRKSMNDLLCAQSSAMFTERCSRRLNSLEENRWR